MKCSMCRKRPPSTDRKTCVLCRERVKRYVDTDRDAINAHKRLMTKLGVWK